MSELSRALDRIAELEEALGLTAELPPDLLPKMHVHHPTGLRRFMGILLARTFADRSALYIAMFGNRPECDQPDIKILDVYAYQTRKLLKLHGITIKTEKTRGWYLDAANKAKLRAVISRLNTEQQQAA